MQIIPVYQSSINAQCFLTSHVHLVNIEGEEFITGPLKTNQTVDIMGLSCHPGLLAKGLQDHTDSLGEQISVAKVFLSIRGESGVHELEVPKLERSAGKIDTKGKSWELALNLVSSNNVTIGERQVPVIWALRGLVNLQTGTVALVGEPIGATNNAEVLGVELNIERVNANRR